jgi:hypothetical protein
MSIDNVPEVSKQLFNQISNSKFDIEKFENIFKQLSDLLIPLNGKINELDEELKKTISIRDQVIKYRDDTQKRIIDEVNIINQKMRNMTGQSKLNESQESIESQESNNSDDSGDSNVSQSHTWLEIARNGKQTIRDDTNKNKNNDMVKITEHISINAYHCTSNSISNAPAGNLLWLTDKHWFALKIIIGEKPVIFEGNIGNIYVRGDVVSNVDLCRQSRIGRQCLKNECTFRHEPPKKGEIRHYFSAPTYYPPRMDNLAREHKGVHRIGSRENLEDDLKRIRASESAFEYNAYIAQTFHSLLVSLVMERGISS